MFFLATHHSEFSILFSFDPARYKNGRFLEVQFSLIDKIKEAEYLSAASFGWSNNFSIKYNKYLDRKTVWSVIRNMNNNFSFFIRKQSIFRITVVW